MSASRWMSAVDNVIFGEQSSAVLDISKEIESGALRLLDLVNGLGPHLTSTETVTRCKATRLLADVTADLPVEFLSEKEVDVLLNFYCDRIKDHHSITAHVLVGMLALCKMPNLSDGNIIKMLKEIFKEVHAQSLAQGDRRYLYDMALYLLENKLHVLQTMDGDFVFGYIQMMDGEKDPRNLLIGFRCVRIISQNLPLGVFAEELFEIVACYFPIDFTPPANDPYKVKRDDLVIGLRGCLSATPKFAEYCLPLLLEKLSSNIQSAKLDSLQTLIVSAELFGAENLKEYLGSFWSQIRREVFAGTSEKVETVALDALTAITRCISNEITEGGRQSLLNEFIKDIYPDCERYLREPEQNLVHPSSKLLQAVAKATDPACCRILDIVLPELLEQFYKHPQANERKSILRSLIDLVGVAKTAVAQHEESPLQKHKDRIYAIFVSLFSDTNFQMRCLGISGIVGLMAVPNMVSANEQSQIAEHLMLLTMRDIETCVRKEAVLALTYMSREFSTVVSDVVLPKLKNVIQSDGKVSTEDHFYGDGDHVTPTYCLHVLCNVSVHPHIIEYSIIIFLDHLNRLLKVSWSDNALEQARTTCDCLRKIVQANIESEASVVIFKSHLLPQCLNLAVQGACCATQNVFVDMEVLQLLAAVIRNIVVHMDISEASNLATIVIQLLFKEDPQDNRNTIKISTDGLVALHCSSPWQQTQLVLVYTSILCSMRKEVVIPEAQTLLDLLFNLATKCTHNTSSVGAAKCLAGLVNKIPDGNQLDETLDGLLKRLEPLLSSADDGSIQRAIQQWVWLTKALVLKNHQLQYALIDKLLTALEDSNLGSLASDGFSTILEEYDDIMTSLMHADIKLLYKQRFFISTMPRLLEGFNQCHTDKKKNYLAAASHLFHFVPKQVLVGEIAPWLNMMIKSLEFENASLALPSLSALYDLVHDLPDLLTKHLDELIPRLLKLIQYKQNMKVRMSAIRCIGALTTLPHAAVYPHKSVIIKALVPGLDDHKRLVRTEAVLARGEWFLLGAPGR